MPDPVPIIGGGPAGAAAALAIARGGGRPVVYEKSRFPRHKLCGEFFSPEALPVLEGLGVAAPFLALRPARVTHAELNFARRHRRFPLPEAGYGLSRYAFDDLLLRAAVERGAELHREGSAKPRGPAVWTVGRSIASTRGRRAFGFKAHFSGPANDAVEVYFFDGGYCGTCPIENGRTNVCGLAREDLLFDVERLLSSVPRLAARLASLERLTRWYIAGPLRFGMPAPAPGLLAAGDAACFVDPFTGSGLLGAVQTGGWAGAEVLDASQGCEWSRCCARQRRRCTGFYRRQLATTALIRKALDLGFAEPLAGLLPGSLLFRLTRPSL